MFSQGRINESLFALAAFSAPWGSPRQKYTKTKQGHVMATQTFSRVLIQAKMMEKNVPARPSVFQLLKHAPIYYLHGKTDESFDLRRPKWFTFSRLGILLPLAASFWSLGKQWAFSARWCFFLFFEFSPWLGEIPIDEHIFKMGGKKPPTSKAALVVSSPWPLPFNAVAWKQRFEALKAFFSLHKNACEDPIGAPNLGLTDC